MQIRVVVAIGAAYFIGYSRGATASTNLGSQLSEGLNKVGDGLTDIAVELGMEFKKYKEDKEEFEKNVVNNKMLNVEEKIVHMGRRRDLYRSDDQIANRLQTTVEDVKRILDEDGPPDIDGDNRVVPSNAGELPDQPGSDAS